MAWLQTPTKSSVQPSVPPTTSGNKPPPILRTFGTTPSPYSTTNLIKPETGLISTKQTLNELGIDPFSLKTNPKKAIKDYWSGVKGSITAAGESLSNVFTEKGSKRAGAILETGARTIGAVLSPITSLFGAAENIPVLGSLSKLVSLPFEIVGDVGNDIAYPIVNSLPISKQQKEHLVGGISEIVALAGQLAIGGAMAKGGKVGLDKITELTKKYGEKDASTIVKKAEEIAQKHVAEKQTIQKNIQAEQGNLPDGRPIPILKTFEEIKPSISSETERLVQEAKKYKSAEEFVNKESFNPNSKFEYHLSDNPNLVVGKTFSEQVKPTNIGERGFGGKQENIGQIFSTKNPQSWSAQLNYEGNIKPQYVYLVEVKNPAKIDIMDGLPHQSINNPADVRIIKKVGGQEVINNPSLIEETKRSQLTDIWNKSQEKPFEPGISITSQKVAMEAKAKGIIDEFPEMSKIEPMVLANEATKAQELIKTNRESALEKIKSVEVPEFQKGAIFKELKTQAMKQGDVDTIRQLAKTNIGTEAAQALKSFDEGIRFDADPVMAVKSLRNTRIKNVEKTQKINVEKMIKTEKAKYREPTLEVKTWSDFIDSITC